MKRPRFFPGPEPIIRVRGSGLRFKARFRVEGLGFRVEGLGFRV